MLVYLKLTILHKFRSQRLFAQAISKSDDWVSRIIIGAKIPTEEEKKLIAEKLGFSRPENIEKLFQAHNESVVN